MTQAMTASSLDYVSFYRDQTVFLTGATGGLGACILYKLAVELPTRKIYALVRSLPKAKQTWQKLMPDHFMAMVNSEKIVLVLGDIMKPSLGIEAATLAKVAHDTTIVINSAANISFSTTALQAVKDNTLSALEVARLVSSFSNLHRFIQISTAYANAFLPDQEISECIYPFYDPESELATILETGTSPHAKRFPYPYAHSKHLSEQLLFSRFPDLPVLVVRPSCVGSAVRSPFPMYGPVKSMPNESFFRILCLNPGSLIFHATDGSETGSNVFDEIPVDWVANLILLHAVKGTKGVVHAVSAAFVPRTFDQMIEEWRDESDFGGRELVFVGDKSVKQCPAPDFYKVVTRGFAFSGKRSEMFHGVEGCLSLDLKKGELDKYRAMRRDKVRADIDACKTRGKVPNVVPVVSRTSRL